MAAGDYTGYADYLASLLPGLCVQVAGAWLAAEGGGPGANNPLNVTRTGSGLDQGYSGGFADYPSVEVGLQAAAWLVMHGLYAGIRAALPTHSPQIQRLAIINSPWAGGHYNHGASFPSVSGPCQAPSGATSGIPDASQTGFTTTSDLSQVDWATFLEQEFGWTPDHVLTNDDLQQIGNLYQTRYGISAGLVIATIATYGVRAGVTVGSLAGTHTTVQDPITQVAQAIGALPAELLGALAPLLVDGAVIVLIVVLALRGTQQLLS